MTSTLSVYLSWHHWWPQTEDYLRRLDPAWIRIHQPDARKVHLAQQLCPNAKIMLRSWDIDDHNGDRKRELYADPAKAGRAIIDRWTEKLFELRRELARNGWAYDEDQWYLGLWNEPDPAFVPQLVAGTLVAMDEAGDLGYRLGVCVSSAGTFAKPEESPHGWAACKPLEKPIRDDGHILMVHEYWQPEGVRFTWTDNEGRSRTDEYNLAWRHHSIPLDVPILIGEAGVNGYLFNRHTDQDNGGWGKYVSPETYAAQVREYIAGCDSRVEGVCLYMTDYHSDQWQSFDTHPAHEQLLAVRDTRPGVQYGKPHTVHLPKLEQPMENWSRSYPHVLKIEGGLSLDPNDPGNWYNGQLVGTKYGISAAVWGGRYDIRNLTEQQALDIYREHYWTAAGCDDLAWPMCLVVFDTTVNHGVGVARELFGTADGNALRYLAERLDLYTRLKTWPHHGAGWARRIAGLLRVVGGVE